jgi:multicomponent Na+:H+ antiporter subunit D
VALPPRAAVRAALIATALTVAATVWLLLAVARRGVQGVILGGWEPPLGIGLAADGLGAAFIAMSAAVMGGVALASRQMMAPDVVGPRAAFGFWPLMLLLWAALNAVFVSRDLFNLYVGLELLSLAAVALVAIGGKEPRLPRRCAT